MRKLARLVDFRKLTTKIAYETTKMMKAFEERKERSTGLPPPKALDVKAIAKTNSTLGMS